MPETNILETKEKTKSQQRNVKSREENRCKKETKEN